MAGQAHGDDRDALHRGVQGRQLVDRLLEHRTVVHTRAQHDLGVDANAQTGEPPQLRQDLRGVTVVEQFAPNIRIGGVD